MLLTHKSIKKNLTKVLGAEDVKVYIFGKSSLHKRILLVLTEMERLLATNTPLFGKLKIKNEYSFDKFARTDFFLTTYMGTDNTGRIFFEYTDRTKETLKIIPHFINSDDNILTLIRKIYEKNPNAIPDYYKGMQFIDFLATNKGMIKIFDKKILLQDLNKDTIETTEEIDMQSITDFDYYSKETGKSFFYLEVNGQGRMFKVVKKIGENSVFSSILGMPDFSINNLIEIFKKTEIPRKMPSFMEENEKYIIGEKTSLDQLFGIDVLGNKFLMLTNKNLYLLKLEKNGKRSVLQKIPLSDIQSVTDTRIKKGDSYYYGIKVILNDGKKIKFNELTFYRQFLNGIKEAQAGRI